jgi:cystathionine gamma-lyase
MQDATLVVRAGMSAAGPGEPYLAGPVFAATYHAPGDPAQVPFTYGRFHNPTWTAYERALSELEGGGALVFGSGMAAVTAVFGTLLSPGDTIVMPSDSYYTGRVLLDGYFARVGVLVRQAPTAGEGQLEHLKGARLVWLESPSNPGLDVCDIARLCQAAHAEGALVAVDNTTATPLGQRPLALGADFTVSSDTKAMSGHADVLLGHVAARQTQWLDQLRTWRSQTGAIAGPMETWLAHRSLATLEVRLARQCANALGIASLLSRHALVRSVRYPGLPGDPAHPVARAQMQSFGPVVSFTLPSRAHAERFLSSVRLIAEATSFGGVHTSAERRARWGGDVVPEGFIRLSAGLEALDDLAADLEQALAAAGRL